MLNIENRGALEDIFGRWPSFHDAEVKRIFVINQDQSIASLEAEIIVFEMTSEMNSSGHFVLKNHTNVVLKFFDVTKEDLTPPYKEDILFALEISEVPGEFPVEVELRSVMDQDIKFRCKSVRVMSAERIQAE